MDGADHEQAERFRNGWVVAPSGRMMWQSSRHVRVLLRIADEDERLFDVCQHPKRRRPDTGFAMKRHELRFEVPPDRVDAIRTSLLRLGATEESLEDRYFDTEDRRLARAGLALRLRAKNGQWEQTLKAASDGSVRRRPHTVSRRDVSGAGLPEPRPEIHSRGDIRPALRRALGADAATARSLRLVHSSVSTRWFVAVDADGTRIAMTLDVGSILAGRSSEAIGELTYELLKGDKHALFTFARAGVEVHGLWLRTASKEWRGERLSRGGGVQLPAFATTTALRDSLNGAAIFRKVARACMAQIVPNAGAVAAGTADEEVIHQLRIGLRRMRTASRDLGGLRARPWSRNVDAARRRIFHALGEVRDRHPVAEAVQERFAEVMTSDVPSPPGGIQALAALVRGTDFQCAMLDMLDVASCKPKRKGAFPRVGDRPRVGPRKARRLIDARLEKLYCRLRKDAEDFAQLDASARHGVRKRLKRLRYLAELVSPLYKRRAAKRFVSRLGPAQEALGAYTDLTTALALAQRAGRAADAPRRAGIRLLRDELSSSVRRCEKPLREAARATPFWR